MTPLLDETVRPGEPWTGVVRDGQRLRIVDTGPRFARPNGLVEKGRHDTCSQSSVSVQRTRATLRRRTCGTDHRLGHDRVERLPRGAAPDAARRWCRPSSATSTRISARSSIAAPGARAIPSVHRHRRRRSTVTHREGIEAHHEITPVEAVARRTPCREVVHGRSGRTRCAAGRSRRRTDRPRLPHRRNRRACRGGRWRVVDDRAQHPAEIRERAPAGTVRKIWFCTFTVSGALYR